jgi:hypothetical protein
LEDEKLARLEEHNLQIVKLEKYKEKLKSKVHKAAQRDLLLKNKVLTDNKN